MRVHLLQIPQGDTLSLTGEEDASALGLEEAGARALSPLSYALEIGISEGGLFVTGHLAIQVRMRCVICLKDTDKSIIVDPFVMQTELAGRERIDLTPFMREDIHLLLPAHPRCDAGAPCRATKARTTAPYPTIRGDSAWGALDKLKQ